MAKKKAKAQAVTVVFFPVGDPPAEEGAYLVQAQDGDGEPVHLIALWNGETWLERTAYPVRIDTVEWWAEVDFIE